MSLLSLPLNLLRPPPPSFLLLPVHFHKRARGHVHIFDFRITCSVLKSLCYFADCRTLGWSLVWVSSTFRHQMLIHSFKVLNRSCAKHIAVTWKCIFDVLYTCHVNPGCFIIAFLFWSASLAPWGISVDIKGSKGEIITSVDWSILAQFAGKYGFSSGTLL